MQLDTATEVVQVNGGQENSAFSIAMNGKAFRVLSDTLYKNKIGSIVRELSCNAVDAHIMNGTPEVPFEIHLPDVFEPWFSVKDYGVGLSPEAVKSVFTVYFQSTKDQSNDTIGAFGLGAKTPFSYTDQFTVTSIVDGVRRDYSAYITESGVPNIICMQEVQVQEPNGVEIQMSVKSQDFSRFKQEVAEQLQYFKVKPVINNGVVTFEEPEALYQGKNAAFFSRGMYSGSQIVIVQGNVGYTVASTDISSSLGAVDVANQAKISNLLQLANIVSIRADFKIGEIGVTASREGVEYNARTLMNIAKKAEEILNEYNDWVSTKIAEYKTDYELAQACMLNPYTFAKFVTKKNFKSDAVSYNSPRTLFDLHGKIGKAMAYSVQAEKRHYRSLNSAFHHSKIPSIAVDNRFGIAVVGPTDVQFRVKTGKFICQENGYREILVLKNLDIDRPMQDFIAEVQKLLDGFVIHNMHEVVLPKVVRTSNPSAPATYYVYKPFHKAVLASFTRETIPLNDLEDEVCYIVTENRKVDERIIARYNEAVQVIGSDDILPLVAIRKTDYEKFKIVRKANFVPADQYLDSVSQSVKNDDALREEYNRMIFCKNISMAVHDSTAAEAICNSESKLKKYFTRVQELRSEAENYDETRRNMLFRTATYAGWEVKDHSVQYSRAEKINKLLQKELDKYPFLRAYLNNWSLRSPDSKITKDHLTFYINAVQKEISQ